MRQTSRLSRALSGKPRSDMKSLLTLQGSYYVVTGIWSIAHRRSFERITGPKTDYWLVRTVGGLAMAIGASLWLARRTESPLAPALAVASGLAFAAADAQAARASSRVYLLDGLLELLLVAAWVRRVRAS